MSRIRLAVVLVAVTFVLGPGIALAQFGSIFGAPPRPPGSVPNGNRQPDPDSYPPPYGGSPTYGSSPPYGGSPSGGQPQYGAQPPNSAPPPVSGRGGPYGAVQSQPLPPPPGLSGTDSNAPAQPTLSGLPPSSLPPSGSAPGQRPLPPRGAPQPIDTTAQPDDQIVAEPPSQKIVNTSAMFSGLDKITGRIINFDAAIGETVQFGALQVTPRACYTRPPTETQNTDAFVEVDEVTLQGEIKRIFTGWMFAASPGLHGVEHAIYDVWLTNCKGAPQTVAATPATDPTPPPSRAQTPQRPAQPRKPPPAPPR